MVFLYLLYIIRQRNMLTLSTLKNNIYHLSLDIYSKLNSSLLPWGEI